MNQQSNQHIKPLTITKNRQAIVGATLCGRPLPTGGDIAPPLQASLTVAVMILLLFLSLWTPSSHAQTESESALQPLDCPFNLGFVNYAVDCGYVTLPENHHQAAESRQLQVAVAIIRSQYRQNLQAPILYLAGGPGAAFITQVPVFVKMFGISTLLKEHDIILVDQRGMGLSSNGYTCNPYESIAQFFDANFSNEERSARMQTCLDDFATQGIDYRNFNSEQNAADLVAIPPLLGYESYHIYGTSYGTLLGLLMLRENPEGLESAILDSVLVPDKNTFELSAGLYSASFDAFIAECEADILCRLAYANLKDLFFSTYERLTATPAEISIGTSTFSFTGAMFADSVGRMLVSRNSMKDLPAYIHAIAHEDYEQVRANFEAIFSTSVTQIPNQALYMTMVCVPHAQTTTAEAIEAAQAPYHQVFRAMAGDFGLNGYEKCQAWSDLPTLSLEPANSNIPVLLLSGALDPLTPPNWASQAAETLPNAQVIVMPHNAHAVGAEICSQRLMLAFLDNPSTALDTTCLSDVSPMNFTIGLSVTRAPIRIAGIAFLALGIWGMLLMLLAAIKRPRWIAWWAALRRVGWLVPLLALLSMVLLLLFPRVLGEESNPLYMVQAMIPLFMAIQVAAIFSSDEEPALEIQLAAPRPLTWLVLERLIVIFITYTLLALVGIGLVLAKQSVSSEDLPFLLFSWLPPALFMSGLALQVSLRSRLMSFGMLMALFLWVIFALFGGFFQVGGSYPFPLNLIQPFMWAFNVHANPETFVASGDYWLNRFFLLSGGLALFYWAVQQVRDEEKVLFNLSQRQRRRQALPLEEVIVGLRPKLSVKAVAVDISTVQQIIGIIRYEVLMHWRRRALKVFALTLLLGAGFLILVLADGFTENLPNGAEIALSEPAVAAIINGITLVMFASPQMLVMILYMFPLITADTVPLDAPMHDILGALPFQQHSYLIGKVLGAACAGLAAILVSTLILGLGWAWKVGVYDSSAFINLVIVSSLLMLLNGAIAILLGSSQTSRLRAVLLVLVYLGLSNFISIRFSDTFISNFLPNTAEVISYYVTKAIEASAIQPLAMPQYAITQAPIANVLIGTCLQIALLWGILWAWRRYQERI